MKKKIITEKIEKFHEKGAGLAYHENGAGETKPVLVWNALPGEEVTAEVVKSKRGYWEAMATEILKASPHRVEPRDAHFLSGSPWQIVAEAKENEFKRELVKEIFASAAIDLPDFELAHDGVFDHYRNKMEYSFWEEDGHIDVALFLRGQRRRSALQSSSLASPAINQATAELVAKINELKVPRGDLKSTVIRSDSSGQVIIGLYVTNPDFEPFELLSDTIRGFGVYYSDRRSPASRNDKKLAEYGEMVLTEVVGGNYLAYGIESFFQVNLPMFEQTLNDIIANAQNFKTAVDFYGGVGTIGLAISHLMQQVTLVESNLEAANFAKRTNAVENGIKNLVAVRANAEDSLDFIGHDALLILDPPRTGLHPDVIKRILEVKPQHVLYLSCNPVTQARDLQQLLQVYKLDFFKAYNFFPRTPHAETLAMLGR